ncbi:MAG: hypothetical protein GY713_12000 [Actinomycetia bacterium]|nr:hypothetical protein [Actinomycetes bacterium]
MNLRRWAPWAILAVVLVAALLWGAGGDDRPADPGERTERLQRQIACPECDGQSVAESNAPVADTIRRFITVRVDEGATDAEIRDQLVLSYGRRVLLEPERTGFVALVWILPIVALLAGLAGLAWAFRSWREAETAAPTAADRDLVEQARRHQAEPDDGEDAR